MKLLATTLISATLLVSANASADTQFVAADNSPGTKLCMAFASNSPLKMNKALKRYRVNKFTIDDKLQCNDLSLAKFASSYGLNRTGKFMNLEVSTSTSIRDLAMLSNKTIYVSGSK